MRRLALFAALLAGGVQAAAPDLGAPPGAEQTVQVESDFDSYPLPVAAFGGDTAPTRLVSGEVRRVAYRLESGTGTAQVVDFYRMRLAEQGYEPILDCAGEACGGFDFRFGAALLPPPEMRMDVRDFAQLTMVRDSPAAHLAAYASALVSRLRGVTYIQVVTVVSRNSGAVDGMPAAMDGPAEGGVVLAPASDEKALLNRLSRDGHVSVAGLEFTTGGAELSAGSAAALDLMARVLAGQPALEVVIVGHSDNVGGLDANIDLSRRRAAAVRAALIERGVAAGRLDARGVGYLAPIRSNATEQGRAVNRRVELVLR